MLRGVFLQGEAPSIGSFAFFNQCRPIGNMHKTIDFIGDLKSDGCFKWHTPSHGVQKCQKAFIFGGFQAFSMGRLCFLMTTVPLPIVG
jgi:hypothetical protein